MERLWRGLKDKLADCAAKTLNELSQITGHMLQCHSQAALQSLIGYLLHCVFYAGGRQCHEQCEWIIHI